jgi:hypothetical protein
MIVVTRSSETSVHTEPDSVSSQKTAFFIVTAVKNLESYILLDGYVI